MSSRRCKDLILANVGLETCIIINVLLLSSLQLLEYLGGEAKNPEQLGIEQ
jgi:hypothetical protein